MFKKPAKRSILCNLSEKSLNMAAKKTPSLASIKGKICIVSNDIEDAKTEAMKRIGKIYYKKDLTYHGIIWINGSSMSSICDSFAKIINDLASKDSFSYDNAGIWEKKLPFRQRFDRLLIAIKKHIKNNNSKWLVVLNNPEYKRILDDLQFDQADVVVISSESNILGSQLEKDKWSIEKISKSNIIDYSERIDEVDKSKHGIYAIYLLIIHSATFSGDISLKFMMSYLKRVFIAQGGKDTFYKEKDFTEAIKYLLSKKILKKTNYCESFYSIDSSLRCWINDYYKDYIGKAFLEIEISASELFNFTRVNYTKKPTKNDEFLLPHILSILSKKDSAPSLARVKLLNSIGVFYHNNQRLSIEGNLFFQKAKCELQELIIGYLSNKKSKWAEDQKKVLQCFFTNNERTEIKLAAEKLETDNNEYNEALIFLGEEVLHNCGSSYLLLNKSSSYGQDKKLSCARSDLLRSYYLQQRFIGEPRNAKDKQSEQLRQHACSYTLRRYSNSLQMEVNAALVFASQISIKRVSEIPCPEYLISNLDEAEKALIELGDKSKEFRTLRGKYIKNPDMDAVNFSQLHEKFITEKKNTTALILMDMGVNFLFRAKLKKIFGKDFKKDFIIANDFFIKSIELYKNLKDSEYPDKNKNLIVAMLYQAESYILKKENYIWAENLLFEAKVMLNNKITDYRSSARIFRHLATLAYKDKKYGLAKLYLLDAIDSHSKIYKLGHFYRVFLADLDEKIDEKLRNEMVDVFNFDKIKSHDKLSIKMRKIFSLYKKVRCDEIFTELNQFMGMVFEKGSNFSAYYKAKNFINKSFIVANNFIFGENEIYFKYCVKNNLSNMVEREKIENNLEEKPTVSGRIVAIFRAAAQLIPNQLEVKVLETGGTIAGEGVAAAVKTVGNELQKNEIYQLKKRHSVLIEQKEKTSGDIAKFIDIITRNYSRQINQLTSKGIDVLARWIVERIKETLQDDTFDGEWEGWQKFMKTIYISNNKKTLKTVHDKKWTTTGLFQNSGIILKDFQSEKSHIFVRNCSNKDQHHLYGYSLFFVNTEKLESTKFLKKFKELKLEYKGCKNNIV